jgi:hypothetical protein
VSTTYVLTFLVISFLLAFPPISYKHSSSPHSCYMPCQSRKLYIQLIHFFLQQPREVTILRNTRYVNRSRRVIGKVLSLWLIQQHSMKTYGGIKFQELLTSEVDCGRFTTGDKDHNINWAGDQVSIRTFLDNVEVIQDFPPDGNRTLIPRSSVSQFPQLAVQSKTEAHLCTTYMSHDLKQSILIFELKSFKL